MDELVIWATYVNEPRSAGTWLVPPEEPSINPDTGPVRVRIERLGSAHRHRKAKKPLAVTPWIDRETMYEKWRVRAITAIGSGRVDEGIAPTVIL